MSTTTRGSARRSISATGHDLGRGLQLALAATWLLDAILKLQAWMFTPDLARTMIAPSGDGLPAALAWPISLMTGVVERYPAASDLAFAAIELGIAVGIAWRPWTRYALLASMGWSLLVSYFGEGLGGLRTGHADPLTGAPGVLLYALLAVLVWPGRHANSIDPPAHRAVGRRPAQIVWIVLWGGLAALAVQPGTLTPDAMHDSIAGSGDGQPAWVAALVNAFATLVNHRGAPFTIAGAIVLAAIAATGLGGRRVRRIGIVTAVVVAAFIWIIGQAAGGLIGGTTTDPNTAPVLAGIALTYWDRQTTQEQQ